MAGIFRSQSDEERAARQEAKEATKTAEQERKAEANYWKSPQGQAVLAFKDGHQFYSYEGLYSSSTHTWFGEVSSQGAYMKSGTSPTDVLGGIEAAGWRLVHTNFVYAQTGSSSRDKHLGASGQFTEVSGRIIGIYLFRRDETRTSRVERRT
jgi:hypothetical protein